MSASKEKPKGKERARAIAFIALPLALVAFGWWNVINTARNLEQNTIRTYQDAQLEIVRNAARAAQVYTEGELDRRGTDPETITLVEREVLAKFVDPVQIGADPNLGDAWIYSPEYVIYDGSPDFPDEYENKSMAEIFDIQKQSGASHYEDMTTSVSEGGEGTGWYIWLPEKATYRDAVEEEDAIKKADEAKDYSFGDKIKYRWDLFRENVGKYVSGEWYDWKYVSPWEPLTNDSGREIAAWTSFTVFPNTNRELTWVVGMSGMLPALMENNGSYDQIASNIYQMLVVTLMVAGLLVFLLRAEAQVQELRQQVQELRVEIDQAKRAEQVSEIVESEYFQDLAKRAKQLRERSGGDS